jgi:hypothetical protein
VWHATGTGCAAQICPAGIRCSAAACTARGAANTWLLQDDVGICFSTKVLVVLCCSSWTSTRSPQQCWQPCSLFLKLVYCCCCCLCASCAGLQAGGIYINPNGTIHVGRLSRASTVRNHCVFSAVHSCWCTLFTKALLVIRSTYTDQQTCHCLPEAMTRACPTSLGLANAMATAATALLFV